MNFIQTTGDAQPIADDDDGRCFAVSPKKGEVFKLVDALKPKVIVLEVCKAMGFAYPPVLLTYKGQVSGALVQQEFHL